MAELPKYYTVLFNAVEDALVEIAAQNYGCAQARLVLGLQAAEDAYLASEDFGNIPDLSEEDGEY